MPTSERKGTVTYSSGTHESLGPGWDAMHVTYKGEHGDFNSFVIACDAGGNIIRKTDIILNRWEAVQDEEDLRFFRRCFDDRDKLAASSCKCGHPFSSHSRKIHETGSMKVDDALLGAKMYDIFSDRPAGESGCTECSCAQWQPANY